MSPLAATTITAAPAAASPTAAENGGPLASFSSLIGPQIGPQIGSAGAAPVIRAADVVPEAAPGDPAVTLMLGSNPAGTGSAGSALASAAPLDIGHSAMDEKGAPKAVRAAPEQAVAEAIVLAPDAAVPAAPVAAVSPQTSGAQTAPAPKESGPALETNEGDTPAPDMETPPQPLTLPASVPLTPPASLPHAVPAHGSPQGQVAEPENREGIAQPSGRGSSKAVAAEAAPSPASPDGPVDAAVLNQSPPPEKAPARAGSAFADLIAPSSPQPGAAPQPAPPASAPPPHPTIAAQPGRVGHELGVAIAHRTSLGGDELTVRLDPAHFGQIEVKMHFDAEGQLRASVTTSQNATLDLLRRDSADLSRAMNDAGIRTDAQSFSFNSRQEGSTGGEREQPRFTRSTLRGGESMEPSLPAAQQPARSITGGGRINMVA